ncbi:MAG: TIR domain-containing protein [Desulfobacterales bacterium]|nr:TIR domain-containing protein [Desulfobacterales bacterium]
MGYKYEVALSFAGEDRTFAETIAEGLRQNSINVFYDNFCAEDLWGEDLGVKLREIYRHSSQYCIMIISENYINKMWPNHERQQAIERMIKEKGKSYILPVRLDGFEGEVPGLSTLIGHLSVSRNEPSKIVEAFLKKIHIQRPFPNDQTSAVKFSEPKIPRFGNKFSDKEKNKFLKTSFKQITDLIEAYSETTQKENSGFEFDRENVSSRKTILTFYKDGKLINQCKIAIGGGFSSNSIVFSYGTHLDIGRDNAFNESVSIEEHDGDLKLKPLGMQMYSYPTGQKKLMSPAEMAEYFWEILFRDSF